MSPRFVVAGAPRGASPLVGEQGVPGDKSIGHRAVIFAALASGRSRLRGVSSGEDNLRTVAALRALGVAIERVGDGELMVDGVGLRGLRASSSPLDCGNSGTTLRLLSGVLAPCPFPSTLTGDEYLQARPMARVATPLRAMGAVYTGAQKPSKKRDGAGEKSAAESSPGTPGMPRIADPRPSEVYPPILVGPAPGLLHGIDYRSPIASAQVKSAVILAALSAEGMTRFLEPSLSRDHSERMLRAMGAPLHSDGAEVVVDPDGWDGRLAARDLVVPGDLSSAAFLLGAALLVPGSRVTVLGVGVNPSRTGVLDALRAMGADISVENLRDQGGEPVADLCARGGLLRGARIDGELAVRAIDELPLLAALAAHADGETVIADAEELRVKESDRIAAMAAALRGMGVTVEERRDGMAIEGARGPFHIRGGRVESRGDHRIAMASAVCALAATGPTEVADVANVATSFPTFLSSLRALGAQIVEDVEDVAPLEDEDGA